MKRLIFSISIALSLITLSIAGCSSAAKSNQNAAEAESADASMPAADFNADSAYAFVEAQCAFGPRVPGSDAHSRCGDYLVHQLKKYGAIVTEQKAKLKAFDGTTLNMRNIIASYNPNAEKRILLLAHWDCRPWADSDADPANHALPVMGANDGASGVAVMLEIARLLQRADSIKVGVDFVCFDAEDWGVPQWSEADYNGDSWALGAQYWAERAHSEGYKARFGILLDMVGGVAATFYREAFSQKYASAIVDKVWTSAKVAGYSSFFPDSDGGMITDDHVPVNEKANIPTVDIIPFYANCEQSSFGPTWHTVNDTMENIDRNTLKAVGQTVIQVLFSEK